MKYAFIEDHRTTWPIAIQCRVLAVSRSGYYEWRRRPVSERAQRRESLTAQIREFHVGHHASYGSPRVHRELRARGDKVNEKTVAKVMREAGIQAKSQRQFRVTTTDSNHTQPVAKNTLNRDFTAQQRNQKWVADITYIATLEGWLYLAAVIDLFTRKVVGWSMSERIDSRLVVDALEMAVSRELPASSQLSGAGLVAHSDRGVQYASEHDQRTLTTHGLECSMSRRGDCWDNAPAESFFATLKKELVHHEVYETRTEARASLFEYIEVFYNRQRLHSSLSYVSPTDFEASAAWSREDCPRAKRFCGGGGHFPPRFVYEKIESTARGGKCPPPPIPQACGLILRNRFRVKPSVPLLTKRTQSLGRSMFCDTEESNFRRSDIRSMTMRCSSRELPTSSRTLCRQHTIECVMRGVGQPLVLRTVGSHWRRALEFEDSAGLVGVAEKAAELQNRGPEQQDEDWRSETDHDGEQQLDAGFVGSLFRSLTELEADTVSEFGYGDGHMRPRAFGLSDEVGQGVHVRGVHTPGEFLQRFRHRVRFGVTTHDFQFHGHVRMEDADLASNSQQCVAQRQSPSQAHADDVQRVRQAFENAIQPTICLASQQVTRDEICEAGHDGGHQQDVSRQCRRRIGEDRQGAAGEEGSKHQKVASREEFNDGVVAVESGSLEVLRQCFNFGFGHRDHAGEVDAPTAGAAKAHFPFEIGDVAHSLT